VYFKVLFENSNTTGTVKAISTYTHKNPNHHFVGP
jgi:hypothetical protein